MGAGWFLVVGVVAFGLIGMLVGSRGSWHATANSKLLLQGMPQLFFGYALGGLINELIARTELDCPPELLFSGFACSLFMRAIVAGMVDIG